MRIYNVNTQIEKYFKYFSGESLKKTYKVEKLIEQT